MFRFSGFTLDWYKMVFADKRLILIVLQTLVVALISATCATIVGVFGALAIYFVKRKHSKQLLLSLNNILMVSPDVVIGASFLIMFTFIGVKLGFWSVLLAHISFCIPIVVIMVYPKLQEMDENFIDVAFDLGGSRLDVMTKVIIPAIIPGIFTGFFMALTYSLDDFAVTFFVTGNGFSTLAIEVYSLARRGISLHINALSTLLFAVILIFVLGFYSISRRLRTKY